MQRWVRVTDAGIVDIGTLPKEYRANDGSLLLDSGKKSSSNCWGFIAMRTPPRSMTRTNSTSQQHLNLTVLM